MNIIRNFGVIGISGLTLITILLVASNIDSESIESTCSQNTSQYSVSIGC